MPLFKSRPAWAASGAQSSTLASPGVEPEVDLFDRSHRARAQLEREEADLKQRSVNKRKKGEVRDPERSAKKRRPSEELDEGSSSVTSVELIETLPHGKSKKVFIPPKSASLAKRASPKLPQDNDRNVVNDLDSPSKRTRSAKPPRPPVELSDTDDDDMDETIQRLAAQARARQEQKSQPEKTDDAGKNASGLQGTPGQPKQDISFTSTAVGTAARKLFPEAYDGGDVEGEIASILVHSRMPDTVPLILYRGVKQSLREVRRAWCTRQGFNDEVSRSVSLYWRGHRVFDSATCESLGIEVNAEGDLYINTPKGRQVFEEKRVAMEIKTKQMHEDDLAGKIADPQGTSTATNNGVSGNDNEGGAIADEGEVQRIRLILRAVDFEEYRVIVKTTTLMSKITTVFAKARNVPSDKEVYVVYDGERIADDATVASLDDIADCDKLDLSIK